MTNDTYSLNLRTDISYLRLLAESTPKAKLDKSDRVIREKRLVRSRLAYKTPISVTKYDNEEGTSFWTIYKVLMQFDGTKEELLDDLWENYATRINSYYSPTGKAFTKGYKVAEVAKGLWKVAEHWGRDV